MLRLFVLARPSGRLVASLCLILAAAGVTASHMAPLPPPHVAAANEGTAGGVTLVAKVFTNAGWVPPGGGFPIVLNYEATSAATGTVRVVLHTASLYVTSTPAPTSGTGTAASPLVYNLGALTPGAKGKIIIEAKAKTLAQDPEVMWKDISADVTLAIAGQADKALRTHGPKVTTLKSARFGDRPFPAVMVQYQDIKHCEGVEDPYPECTGDHNAQRFDEAVNSKTSGNSLWQLYQDMSFGQLYPIGTVAPPVGSTTVPFDPAYNHKFSQLQPNGTCMGTTLGAAHGTPVYGTRIENGWYLLPGNQGYYGSDSRGSALAGALAGLATSGIDDACGPTGKIVYDAASLADPDIDYNEYDTDKDGVVDFFNLMFAGCGGHGCLDPTGPGNIWPHKSDLRYYFEDGTTKVKGYISNDQLKDHYGRPLYYVDATRSAFTTSNASGLPVFVVVGPYNVNPESAVDAVSVVAHEYGHSLGLPDFYAYSFDAFGSWELMGTDYFQYFSAYTRKEMGWVVPRPLTSGTIMLREQKYDTGEIHWYREDGTPYVLTGPGIHNSDMYQLNLPTELLIDEVPSGEHAWYSGSGADFGCPTDKPDQHTLDFMLPDLALTSNATAITLKFKSQYEMEWDWDYGYVMVSDNGGETWTALPSAANTTIAADYNPNTGPGAECHTRWNHGITGVSGTGPNTVANQNRHLAAAGEGGYPAATWIDDQFDLTAYKGKNILLRFAYVTDPAANFRGWFIDDIEIKADNNVVYKSDFESGTEDTRILSTRWLRASTSQGVDLEHAYFLELRDRINNDFDGKGQSERGVPGWEAAVSLIYSDRLHSYGNTSASDHPGQTPVDANPQPGNTSPDLNDAGFTLTRPTFNGCTHIDNYEDPDGPDGLWKLPPNLKFTVTSLVGFSAGGTIPGTPSTATLIAEVNPNCDLEILPPELSIDAGYEDPDTNGAYSLKWTRPADAVGPETLQEATVFAVLFEDNAESGLGKWVTTTVGSGANAWQQSGTKVHGGANAFWGRYTNGSDTAGTGNVPATILTMKDAVAIPADGETLLSYWDFFMNEGDDSVVLEVTTDDGATWQVVNQASRSALAPDAAPALATEDMAQRVFPLEKFKGESIKVRFRMQSGGEDRAGSAPLGWYVDDVRIETNNFADILTTPDTAAALSGRATGTYFYRVRTAYPAGPVTVPSGYSNVLELEVAEGVVGGGGGGGGNVVPQGAGNNKLGGSMPGLTLLVLGLLGLGRRRVRS